MRPSSGEVATALYGAWRLMRFDSKAMSYFDKSVDGFWKSFYAAVFWVPLMTIVSFVLARDLPVTLMNILGVAMNNIAYLFVFPLVFLGACNVMGWQKNFIGCIVALNWTRVFYISLLLPVSLIIPMFLVSTGDNSSAELMSSANTAESPSAGLLILLLGLALYLLAFEIFVYSRSLEISIPAGIGVVVLELVIALVWSLTHSIIVNVTSGIGGGVPAS